MSFSIGIEKRLRRVDNMDTLTSKQRSARMRLVKSVDTKPELKLKRLVRNLGYPPRKNKTVVIGKPDIVFAGRRCAIFLHGCFWHRHVCHAGQRTPKSRVQFWKNKFTSNVNRDKFVASQLKKNGWRALVVWECELKNPAKVSRRVKRFLNA
ncbi:MAG TPA: DNA mismatch endonuclease Vsr [Candidatus Angelobacter sp.]|nr:DNA mismatch endonuclease Vsr [Candidatus Angelobacter sp.]